jgi:putative membrane protein
MRIVMVIFYLLIIIIGVSFAALNATSISVNFYFTTWVLPTSVLIIISLGIGVLLGILFFLAKYLRLKSAYRRLKGQLKLTEKEIINLRAIPLQNQ